MNIETQAAAWDEIRETFKVNQTANGPGSTIEYTEPLREWLPQVLKTHDVYSVLDAPCGDLNWAGLVDFSECDYTGWDVNERMVELNRIRYRDRHFFNVNLLDTQASIAAYDLIICRDFLFHLPNEQALQVLNLFKDSGSRLLVTTTHAGASNHLYNEAELGEGVDDRPGYWYRPIDVEAEPFNLKRIDSVREDEGREMVLVQL